MMKKLSLVLSVVMILILIGCVENKPTIRLETPTNLKFEIATLTFDEVEHATSYIIIAEGLNAIVNTNSYTFPHEGVYKVRVVARAKGYLDSLYSTELEVVVSFTDQKPYMISSKDITTNFKDDIKLSFASLGYTFKSLNGYAITSSDYTYVNDVLTIKASFLKIAFEKESERTSLIFSYTFEKDDQTHLGFITIKK